MDLDDRLRSNLRSRAQQISSSNVRLAQVEGRGRRRRRRRTAAAGVSLFALLAGATVGAVRLLEPEDHSDVIAAGTIEYPRADSAGTSPESPTPTCRPPRSRSSRTTS